MASSNGISKIGDNPCGIASTLPPSQGEKQSTEPPGILREPVTSRARKYNTEIPNVLPHERVFPIQIGSELYRLSGASLSSDGLNSYAWRRRNLANKPRAPSYFSQYFKCQLHKAEENGDDSNTVKTLYIDRDPVTFKDISLHLQGYHVSPRDASHFVKLFADAQFYSLPRLISQLYDENIFISIGHRDFQIPREVFSDPGNSPNYFSLGFAVSFSSPSEIFPGLERDGLLRPPSLLPPSVPNRSADTFAEILHLLRGYPLHVRDDDHRAELLRDCKYFHFKGLEQKLIRHHISFNVARQRQEIVLRLEDLRQSGVSVAWDSDTPPLEPQVRGGPSGWIKYARPFVDNTTYELVLEIGDECTKVHLHTMRAEFFGDGKTRISRLFEVIATKLNLPIIQPLGLLMAKGGASSQPASPGNTPISEDQVRIVLDAEAFVLLDNKVWHSTTLEDEVDGTTRSMNGLDHESPSSSVSGQPPRKRKRVEISGGQEETWLVKTGQWRLRVQNTKHGKGGWECVLVAVKLNAVSGEQGRNAQRAFLA